MTDPPNPPQTPPPPPASAAPIEATPQAPAAAGISPSAEEALATVGRIREEIGRAVVGQDDVVEQVLAALLAGGHVLLEGVPGVGKTLLALALARTFGGRFSRVQFTPDLMPSDVTGHSVYKPDTGEFRIRRGPAFTNLLLADEINRAPAKTQAALLEVMQEQQVSIEGRAFPLPGPFMALATQNPVEHEGTYPLPEAQLDRFLLKVLIHYPPTVEEEVAIVSRVTTGRTGDRLDVDAVGQVVDAEGVLALQRFTGGLLVDDRILDDAVRLVRRTRTWGGLRLGTGPRGAIALVRVARAFALLSGRDFVVPDDIKRATAPVLRHRVLMAPDLEMSGQDADQVLESIVDDVEAPRQ
ncbi:MAG: MoxR family ATPase [Acidobacteriota bacterium]